MINSTVINSLYKKYRRQPKTIDALNLSVLYDTVSELHNIVIAENSVTIGSIDLNSPFNSLLLKHIHGIETFENYVAIILRSAILFLDKKESKVRIHIKTIKRPSVLRMLIAKLFNR